MKPMAEIMSEFTYENEIVLNIKKHSHSNRIEIDVNVPIPSVHLYILSNVLPVVCDQVFEELGRQEDKEELVDGLLQLVKDEIMKVPKKTETGYEI